MNDMMNMMDGMHWGMGLSRDRSAIFGKCLALFRQNAEFQAQRRV
jgi:hypothetical protein